MRQLPLSSLLLLLLSLAFFGCGAVAGESEKRVGGEAATLMQWLEGRGIALPPDTQLRRDRSTQEAALLLPPASSLSLPRSAWLTLEEALETLPGQVGGGEVVFSYPEEVFLVWLLFHRALGPSSPYAAYVGTYAERQSLQMPLMIEDAEWEWLDAEGAAGGRMRQAVRREARELRVLYDRISSSFLMLDPIAFPPALFRWEDYLWAYASLMARVSEGADGRPVLLPLLDLLPRTRDAGGCHITITAHEAVLVPGEGEADVRAGGRRCRVAVTRMTEAEFFFYYGGVDGRGEGRVPVEVDLEKMSLWKMFVLPWMRRTTPDLLLAFGAALEHLTVPVSLHWDSEEMRVLRLLGVRAEKVTNRQLQEVALATDGEGESLASGYAALRFLYEALQLRLQNFPDVTHLLEQEKEGEAAVAVGLDGSREERETEAGRHVTGAVAAWLAWMRQERENALALGRRVQDLWNGLLRESVQQGDWVDLRTGEWQ